MKIAYFTDTFLPQINGVATSIANFARELGSRGHQILIVTPRPPKYQRANVVLPNVRILHLPSLPAFVYPGFRMSPLLGLPREFSALRAFDPDIIHFHTTLMISFDAILLGKLLGKPIVGTNHVYWTRQSDDYIKFISTNRFLRTVVTRIALWYSFSFYAFCDLRLAPSQLLIDELKRTGYRRSFSCLPSGIPDANHIPLTEEERRRLKEKYGLRDSVVLHIGRLSLEKNVDTVIRTFARVCAHRDNVSLLLVGDGPDRPALEALARELGVLDRMAVTGFIPPDQLMSSGLPRIGDVFVSASTMESQGMVIVEAMSYGLPIVAMDAAAVPEVVAGNGILVAKDDQQGLADGIERILSDRMLAERLSRLSLERAAQYLIPVMTDRLLSLYQETIDRKRAC